MSRASIVGLVFFGLIHVLTMVNDSHQESASHQRTTQYRQELNRIYK